MKLGGNVKNQQKVVLTNDKPNKLSFIKGFTTPSSYWFVNLAMFSLIDWLSFLEKCLRFAIFIPL
jgi:hypothetical protein